MRKILSTLAVTLAIFSAQSAAPAQESITQPAATAPPDFDISAQSIACSVPGLICIRVAAANLSSAQGIILDGAQATLLGSGSDSKALTSREAYKRLQKEPQARKFREQLAVGMVTAGLGSMIAGDAIDKKRGGQEWLGRQAKRRNTDESMFEERVLLPSDHTSGLVYFAGALQPGSRLRLPIRPWHNATTSEWPSQKVVSVTGP